MGKLSEKRQKDDGDDAGEVHNKSDDDGAENATGLVADSHQQAVNGELQEEHPLRGSPDEIGGKMQSAAAEIDDPGIEQGEGFGALKSQDAGQADGERGNRDAEEQGPEGYPATAGGVPGGGLRSAALFAGRRRRR